MKCQHNKSKDSGRAANDESPPCIRLELGPLEQIEIAADARSSTA